jgi:ABC-2 type transport system permease protein
MSLAVNKTIETRTHYVLTIWALVVRDIRVLLSRWVMFLVRVISQPILIVFVLAYVFPKIGQGIGGSAAAEAKFSTLLVAGVVGISIITQGIQAVALPLVQEFSYTREIEDRVLAPVPIWGVATAKIISGALQALIAALVVFIVSIFIPATTVHLSVDWPLVLTIIPLAAVLSGALGLAIGTIVPPTQVAFIFAIILLPMTFLGAVYYPWTSLSTIPWLKWAVLINPLIYINEGLRAALTTGIPHMNLIGVYAGLVGFFVFLLFIGIRGFQHRVIS